MAGQKAGRKFGRNAKSAQNAAYKSGRATTNKQKRVARHLKQQQKHAEKLWMKAQIKARAAVDPRLKAQLEADAAAAQQSAEAAKAARAADVRSRWLSWRSKLAAARKQLQQSH